MKSVEITERDRALDPDLKPRALAPGDRFSLVFFCSTCNREADYGCELKNRKDGRIFKICARCSYEGGFVVPGEEPKIWKRRPRRENANDGA